MTYNIGDCVEAGWYGEGVVVDKKIAWGASVSYRVQKMPGDSLWFYIFSLTTPPEDKWHEIKIRANGNYVP